MEVMWMSPVIHCSGFEPVYLGQMQRGMDLMGCNSRRFDYKRPTGETRRLSSVYECSVAAVPITSGMPDSQESEAQRLNGAKMGEWGDEYNAVSFE